MGQWFDSSGKRTILSRNGDNIIEKNPDLPWYGGDIYCTEYAVELDEATATLILRGITTWVSSSLDSDERSLEMDASSSSVTITIAESSDGTITAIACNGKILTK